MIKVMMADDHSYLITGVIKSLENTEIQVVCSTGSVVDIISLYMKHKPDVLIVDIMFDEKKNGIDIVSMLLEVDDRAKVIVFSQIEMVDVISNAYDKGIKAFLTKRSDTSTLIEAIRTVYSGEMFFDSDIAVKLGAYKWSPENRKAEDQFNKLNERERNVLRLLGNFKTEGEISVELGISVRTVSNVKQQIKVKLGIDDQAGYTRAAVKFKLADLDGLVSDSLLGR